MNLIEMEVLTKVSQHIIDKIHADCPKWQSELKGTPKKAYEGYIKSIEDDKEYVRTAKEFLKKEKEQEIKFLETERFYAELVFTYIQNYYYLKPKANTENIPKSS